MQIIDGCPLGEQDASVRQVSHRRRVSDAPSGEWGEVGEGAVVVNLVNTGALASNDGGKVRHPARAVISVSMASASVGT